MTLRKHLWALSVVMATIIDKNWGDADLSPTYCVKDVNPILNFHISTVIRILLHFPTQSSAQRIYKLNQSISQNDDPPSRRKTDARRTRLRRATGARPKPSIVDGKTGPRSHHRIILLERTMFRIERGDTLRPSRRYDLHRRCDGDIPTTNPVLVSGVQITATMPRKGNRVGVFTQWGF